ncbi:MAG: hypothetical protein V2I43_27835 [Parvularcula sp.]|jgi:hypothetical protein|nr:hypothetical protein [Parvularcula sp.]
MDMISPGNNRDGERPPEPNAFAVAPFSDNDDEALVSLTALVEQALGAADEIGLPVVGIHLCSALELLKERLEETGR